MKKQRIPRLFYLTLLPALNWAQAELNAWALAQQPEKQDGEEKTADFYLKPVIVEMASEFLGRQIDATYTAVCCATEFVVAPILSAELQALSNFVIGCSDKLRDMDPKEVMDTARTLHELTQKWLLKS